ncbi:glycosyltransferase [Rhodopila globiformis]|uniref:Glycosyltransferase 2-like domain-containing protein n=1 Tax=Rhodopila globiformis TaxID=1071 RepID=A0A2S6N174_RHOGL|nr:glycosyltransferase [Rhodopila globiformis]PPQ28336.1 hypothetical protein CCS01_24855 [Rhodopila globiformis]
MKPPANRTALTISAVIPLYNGRRFIRQALDSVAAQTRAPCEIIVVDDGSTDDGAAIVRDFAGTCPVRLLSKPNGGQSSARNFGVAHAQGDLIALLDQDDCWYPHHLEKLARPFEARQPIPLGWTYSNLDEIDEAGTLVARGVLHRTESRHPKRDLIDCLRQDMFILPSASLIARAAFNAVGGFDERLTGYEDDDLFLRLFSAGYQNLYVDQSLSQWRIYSASTSFSPRMNRSRMTFARKLAQAWPDDALRGIFYTRDLIAPRFLCSVAETMRRALRARDTAVADACLADIAELEALVDPAQRARLVRTSLLTTTVIPLRNGAGSIEAALTSVMQQTQPADEIIVVDHGSTDDGPAIVRRMAETYPITLLSQPNVGQSAARNLGVRQAHGDLIALLDQGDSWYPSHLAELTAPFQEKRSRPLGWVYGNLDKSDQNDNLVGQSVLGGGHLKTSVLDCLGQDMSIPLSAAVIARQALQAVGGFDEQLHCCEADDLFIRLLQAGYDNVFINKTLSRWRVSGESDRNGCRDAASRMVFARKLMDAFPDDDAAGQYPVRDLIAPRFVTRAVADVRQALRSRDQALIDRSLENLRFLDSRLRTEEDSAFSHREPLISAVIPLYNGGAFIEEAILSVVGQTLKPDEIIVVDDGSTDHGPELVERMAATLPIRLIRQENAGQSAARNAGVDHAHGDLIALLDQDDIWYPTHLAELVAPFRQPRTTELGWSYSDLDEIDEQGQMVCRGLLAHFNFCHPKRDLVSCLRHDMFILPSSTLVSRRAFEAVGGFNERLSGYEDDDLFLRLFRAGYDCAFLPQPLSKWRIFRSSSSFSPRMTKSRLLYAQMLIEQFPDDEAKSLYYARDLIAPRFFRTMAADFRRAVLSGNRRQQRELLGHMMHIADHLRPGLGVPFRFVLLPMLHIRPLAQFAMRYHSGLSKVMRRIL